MSTLKLVLKYKWYDMIESGQKLEEYREIKESIISLLFDYKQCGGYTRKEFTEAFLNKSIHPKVLWMYFKNITHVKFYRGYSKDRKEMVFIFGEIDIGEPNPKWYDSNTLKKDEVFRIKLLKKCEP